MKKLILLGFVLAVVAGGCSLNLSAGQTQKLSIDEIKVKATNFINDNLMQEGNEVSIKEVVEESDLYKVVVNVPNGQEITSYITKDGKTFFPQAMDIAEVEKQSQEAKTQEEAAGEKVKAELPKTSKPKVEVFVMSHCPYGTQIEKGILPVAKLLGDKIDLDIKFCDYAMHGKKELDEQLAQHCIKKNEPTKFLDYLNCFLGSGDGTACLTSTKIDQGKLSSCVSATDAQFKVTEKYNDKSTWVGGNYPAFDVYKADNEKYGVQGSPTLVINGTEIPSGRDSASLLTTICSGFENQPAECGQTLSTATPAPGFGAGTTDAASDASCE